MALEVPEELIPLERCLKKDHAKLKNGRPGTLSRADLQDQREACGQSSMQ